MPKTFLALETEIIQVLQDTSPVDFGLTEVAVQLELAIREVSIEKPRIVRHSFKLETRTGSATATTSGALVDSTESQFLATDVDKVIYNTDDRTWAVVTAYVSATQLTLSKNIMASGEDYTIFNKGCISNLQINLADIEDYEGEDRGVVKVEFLGSERNYTVDGDILTIKYDSGLDDSKDADADVEVWVWIKRRHQVTQLTQLTGAIDNPASGYSENDTTIHVDGLNATGTVTEDTELTIAGCRGTYLVTKDATLASNECDLIIWPPLESDITDGDVITITGSTLTRELERLVVEIAAARCAISKGVQLLREAILAIGSIAAVNTALGLSAAKVLRTVTDIGDGRTEIEKVPALITLAATEIGKIKGQVTQAIASLDSGRSVMNAINVGGPNVPGQHANQAAGELASARGHYETATGYFTQAQADQSVGVANLALATAELQGALGNINEAGGYLRKIQTDLSISHAFRDFQSWGEAKLALALSQLRQGRKIQTKRIWPRD